MGGKSSGKVPKAPDPYQLSDAQTQSNQDTAAYNAALGRVNTYTPYGSQEFTNTGVDPTTGAPIYRQDINLSPEQQQLFDLQQQQNLQLGNIGNSQASQLGQLLGQPINGDVGQYRQQAQDALYDRNTAYLDRDFSRFEDRERNRLANQGVVEGSEAWKGAMDRLEGNREMAYRQARNESIAGGGAEADRSLNQLFSLRNQPINEFNAVRNSSQISLPNFQGPGQASAAPTDVSGNVWNAYQGNLNAYNARQASNNSLWSTLGGIAGLGLGTLTGGASLFALSDERLKEDIDHTGTLPDGTNVYEYTFTPTGERQTGVMAQEVEKAHPDSVITTPSGVKMVDYAKVLARALNA